MSQIKQKIEIKIDTQGNSRVVDVIGAGANCQELTKGIESALGVVDEKSREATSSAYQNVDPIRLSIQEG